MGALIHARLDAETNRQLARLRKATGLTDSSSSAAVCRRSPPCPCEAVLAEACYLLRGLRGAPDAARSSTVFPGRTQAGSFTQVRVRPSHEMRTRDPTGTPQVPCRRL